MGNCWRGISDAKLQEYELRMLSHSGMDVEAEFTFRNVRIDSSGNFVRMLEVGDASKPVLVLIHGYGGSAIMFWKIFKPLAANFRVLALDILGMGGSSRPSFKIKDPDEADNYLVEWLEAWRLNVVDGGLSGFNWQATLSVVT